MNISGRQALGQIDGALERERKRSDQLDRAIADLSERREALNQARAKSYGELARLRVDQIAGGKLADRLDAAERRAANLLASRKAARTELDQRIQAAAERRSRLEEARSRQAQTLDQAADAVDEAEAKTQARLAADPDYQAREQRSEQAERIARHAADKAENSEAELQDKGEAYAQDPLFMYLWRRHYGTAEYHANNFIRWLDGKVAHLVGYADAQVNYARLQEIPVRLREHAAAMEQEAGAEFEALRKLDRQAREEDGIPALETAREEEQARLEDLDRQIEQAAAAHQDLLDEKASFAADEDDYYRKAAEYLSAEFRREDLQQLRRDAVATPFPEDDIIVGRLLDLEQDEAELEQGLAELKRGQQEHHGRLRELETVRSEFRRRGYDRVGSSFADAALLASMLGNFLDGMVNGDRLLRLFKQQHRYQPRRSNPGFGSGGFGRGTVWSGGLGNMDVNDLGRILNQLGRIGGGGGFSRRGGYGGGLGGGGGGGGFRTGGGF